MKKKLVSVVLGTLMGVLFLSTKANASTKVGNLYPTCGIVTEVTSESVTFRDFNGYFWCFLDPEDWEPGDRVAAVMDDSGTETILDDKIVATRYCGWVY